MTFHLVPMSPLKENDLEAIHQERWSLDCLHMQLLRGDTQQVHYSGPGCIRHAESGGLEYVLYDPQVEVSLADAFGHARQPGDFLGPEDFFTLIATTVDGHTWVAELVDADTSSSMDRAGAV